MLRPDLAGRKYGHISSVTSAGYDSQCNPDNCLIDFSVFTIQYLVNCCVNIKC